MKLPEFLILMSAVMVAPHMNQTWGSILAVVYAAAGLATLYMDRKSAQ